jgi:hypothetical protein
VQQDGTTMKKKYPLLLTAIGVIAAYMVVAVVVLPTMSGVTKANFDRIKVGMTHAEVVEILGEEPVSAGPMAALDFGRTGTGPGITHTSSKDVYEVWQAADGSIAWVSFRYDCVRSSLWLDSNESFWDKLRRWVGLK